ncbi:MAG: beta-ketoacyl-ACP synthase II [Anaerolineales bacterium]
MERRVVITGMGTINPLGIDVMETWEALKSGTSGVGRITLFDPSDLLVKIACEVKQFDPARYMDPREARRRDRFEQFASAAAAQAMRDSGLEIQPESAGRVGVIISSAVGGMDTLQTGIQVMANDGPRRISPFTIPMFMSNGASGIVAIDIGVKGPSFSIASACASGADAIGLAATLIRTGVMDACLTGATEAIITRFGVASFDRLGALSRRNEDFSQTPAPFDMNRDGLVVGEGAAVIILEDLEHARNRGVEILAELVGYGSTTDAFHITAPSETGAGGASAIQNALAAAAVNADEIDYINAHGTGTKLNDISETKAIKAALGEVAYHVPISSTKSMTGHMMGATGALEAIICVLAIRDGILPPTIHLNDPDPECDLDYVPNDAREVEIEIALSNAFGFGGHNAVLAFRRFTG